MGAKPTVESDVLSVSSPCAVGSVAVPRREREWKMSVDLAAPEVK